MSVPEFKNRPNDFIGINKVTHDNDGNKTVERTNYFISRSVGLAGVVVALGVESEPLILVTRRSNSMPDEKNKLCCPCGYIDWDENAFNGIIREVFEETSLYLNNYTDIIKFHNNFQPVYTVSDPTSKTQNISLIHMFVMDFNNVDNFPSEIINYKCREVSEVMWMKLSEVNKTKDEEWAFYHKYMINRAISFHEEQEKIKIALDFYNLHGIKG